MGGERTRRHRRLRPGKIITQVIVFLLLGAIVNVAVAWGCIVAADWPIFPDSADYQRMPADLFDIGWPSDVPEHWPPPYEFRRRAFTGGLARRFFGEIYESKDGDPSVVRTSTPSMQDLGLQPFKRDLLFGIDLIEAGWPFRALGSQCWEEQVIEETSPGQSQSHYVIAGHPSPAIWHMGLVPPAACPGFNRPDDEWKRLPLRPLWPGFIVNTLFYAIILWLLIPGPFVLRRVIRIKRGRCPKCGYDLRGQPPETGAGAGRGCPECGWKREVEA